MDQQSYPYRDYLTKSVQEVCAALQTSLPGLTDAEASARTKKFGPNRIPRKRTHWLRIFLRQYKSPFIYLLGFAAAVAFFLGEAIDAATIIVILLVNGFLGFFQEYRAEKSVDALEQLLIPVITVRRGGALKKIPSHELVAGDIVPLDAGDIVCADIRILETQGLILDESILTGESVQVGKSADAMVTPTAELAGANNVAFSGTHVVGGRGLGVVVATGSGTVLGKIARRIHQIERRSGYEEHLERFSKFMMRVVVVTIMVLFAVHMLLKGVHGSNTAELLLFVLALAISVVPEALPVVTTLTLANGAARLAKDHVVVRRLSALEDLGNIDVLCTDKTGTITENKMQVMDIVAPDEKEFLTTVLKETAWLVSKTPGGITGTGSFDQALFERAGADKLAMSNNDVARTISWDLPFDPKRRYSAIVQHGSAGTYELLVRGAPEELLARADVGAKDRGRVLNEVGQHGKQGKRVLALARRVLSKGEQPGLESVRDLEFLGYATFEDPLKPTTLKALEDARSLGVDVRVITGDSAEVAFAVGVKIGLVKTEQEVQTGAELRALSSDVLDGVIERTKIFARVSPEEKFLIIKSLQKNHSVGFLGEGVNDAPALEEANAALVVDSAAPVAREAADVILLRRDLGVIIAAIGSGRRIFENVEKYLKYTLVGNFGNFYTIAAISLILPFIPLLPVQILLTNLLTDFPLIAVSVDRVSEEEIKKPRSFALRPLILASVFLGIVSSLFDFLFFGIFHASPAPELRTLWFMFSICTELVLIFSIRTRRPFWKGPRPALTLTCLAFGAGIVSIALPFIPFTRTAFHFIFPSATALGTIFVIAVGYFFATEGMKNLLRRFLSGGSMAQSTATLSKPTA